MSIERRTPGIRCADTCPAWVHLIETCPPINDDQRESPYAASQRSPTQLDLSHDEGTIDVAVDYEDAENTFGVNAAISAPRSVTATTLG